MSANNLIAFQPSISEQALFEEFIVNKAIIMLRRFNGPKARELYLCCRPSGGNDSAEVQAKNIYSGIREVLKAEGVGLEALTSETIFFRDIESDITPVRHAIQEIIDDDGGQEFKPARTEIQQPPLDRHANVEIAIQAIIPAATELRTQQVCAKSGCQCGECDTCTGLRLEIGDKTFLMAGGLCGDGPDAYTQTHSMFALAETLLHEAGMEFSDVMRTWIYLRHMERDYPELNRARREFFESRGINPVPASTGIEGGMVNDQHDLCIGFYAVKSVKPLSRTVMTSATLNEAGEYGADFVRGMRVEEDNKVALHVSGTASIDEQGRTAHIGDAAAQIDRMILNIRELLANQGADFNDIVYAYNYLKDPSDEALLRDKFREAGLEGFPSVFVNVEVCRPDLLCETEVLAILPPNAETGGEGHLRIARPVA